MTEAHIKKKLEWEGKGAGEDDICDGHIVTYEPVASQSLIQLDKHPSMRLFLSIELISVVIFRSTGDSHPTVESLPLHIKSVPSQQLEDLVTLRIVLTHEGRMALRKRWNYFVGGHLIATNLYNWELVFRVGIFITNSVDLEVLASDSSNNSDRICEEEVVSVILCDSDLLQQAKQIG